MPENNQAQDAYDPPPITNEDFEELKFNEIEVDDLFWTKDRNTPDYKTEV